ncbi:MAG: hypothetical protein ICV73_22015 [Acetobacteraceae bacterium]|nr:hypothetical protein [Acetobacteraceae bacterium]
MFSSEAATGAVARRIAREAAAKNTEAAEALLEGVVPVGIAYLKRGKLPRAALEPAFNGLLQKVHGGANVVHLQAAGYRTSRHGLSAKVDFNARVVLTQCNPNAPDAARDFGFLAIDLSMNRHKLHMRLDPVDVVISPHALARFSLRNRQEPRAFFDGIMQALRAARFLSGAAARHAGGRIAVPHAGGLLLGRVEIYDDPEEGRDMPCRVRFDRNGRFDDTLSRPHPEQDYRLSANLRTFVSGESATGVKAELLEVLAGWMEEHARAIEDTGETLIFGSPLIRPGDHEREVQERVRALVRDTMALIESPLWHRFASSRAEGSMAMSAEG